MGTSAAVIPCSSGSTEFTRGNAFGMLALIRRRGSAAYADSKRSTSERFARGVSRYSAIPEAFPDDARWPTRSVGTYCRDGLIVARYHAEEDSFQFEVSPADTIHEAARRLGAGDLRHHEPYAPGAKGWITSFSNFGVAIRDEDT